MKMSEINYSFEDNEADLMDHFKHITSSISKGDQLVKAVENTDIVILLGNTKSGKSTLCNYLIGNQLIGVKRKTDQIFRIVATIPGQQGPLIGERAYSETTLPTVWSTSKIPEIIVDAPGFDSNRGEVQDIANCSYIKNMILKSKSVKFVLVCDINEILCDNINSFINFVDKVYSMQPTPETLQRGTCLVITKSTASCSVIHIRKYLEGIDNENNVCIKRSVLRSFINDNSSVVCFQAPNGEGPIDEGIGPDVINAINELKAIPSHSLPAMRPVLSNTSCTFLLFTEKQLSENVLFYQIFKTMPKDFAESLKGKIANLHDTQSAENVKSELLQLQEVVERLKYSVENNDCLLSIFDGLKHLCNLNLQQQIEKGDLKTVLQFIDFINHLIGRPGNALLRLHFDVLVDRMADAIESSVAEVSEIIDKISEQAIETRKKRIRELSAALEDKTQFYEERIDKLVQELTQLRTKEQDKRRRFWPCSIM